MKKQYVLIFISMFLFFACTEQTEMELTKEDLNDKDTQNSTSVDKYVQSVLEAAEKAIPFKKEDGYTIGVLDENRQENECHVVYSNEKEFQKFRFVKEGDVWLPGSLIESKKIDRSNHEKNYTAPIAYISGEYTLLDVLYCDEYYSGNYSISRSYWEPYLAWSLDFYPGTQVNNGKIWQVCCGNGGTYYGGTNWVLLNYRLDVYDMPALPSAPVLQSPGNGATTASGVNFTWNAVSGQGVNIYEIEVSNGSSATTSGTSKSFSGFAYNTSYTWRVRAHNITGWGEWSAANSFTVQNPPLSVSIVSLGSNQYRANVTGGTGNYTNYNWWYMSINGTGFDDMEWVYNPSWSSNTITYYPLVGIGMLKCQVTDSGGHTAEDIF